MTDDDLPIKPATRLVQAGRRAEWTKGVVNVPVWRGSTVLYDNVAHMRATGAGDLHEKLFYGRKGLPTQWSLADALTSLEPGAEATFLYPSGVAAIAAALLSVLSPGDELLLVDSAYDPTRGLATGLLTRMGVTTRFYDPLVGAGIAELIGPATKAIFLESPGSLSFEVQDIPAIVEIAKARGITTILDNTWATPLFFPAIEKGVDLTVLACTKYVVGHSDAMLGSVTAAPSHWAALRDTSFQLGQVASPDDAYLGSRGLRTMGVRLASISRAHWPSPNGSPSSRAWRRCCTPLSPPAPAMTSSRAISWGRAGCSPSSSTAATTPRVPRCSMASRISVLDSAGAAMRAWPSPPTRTAIAA